MKCTWKIQNDYMFHQMVMHTQEHAWVHAMLCCGVLRYVSRPDSDSADKIIHALLKQKHTTFLLIHPSFKLKAFIYAMCNDCYI